MKMPIFLFKSFIHICNNFLQSLPYFRSMVVCSFFHPVKYWHLHLLPHHLHLRPNLLLYLPLVNYVEILVLMVPVTGLISTLPRILKLPLTIFCLHIGIVKHLLNLKRNLPLFFISSPRLTFFIELTSKNTIFELSTNMCGSGMILVVTFVHSSAGKRSITVIFRWSSGCFGLFVEISLRVHFIFELSTVTILIISYLS